MWKIKKNQKKYISYFLKLLINETNLIHKMKNKWIYIFIKKQKIVIGG